MSHIEPIGDTNIEGEVKMKQESPTSTARLVVLIKSVIKQKFIMS